MSCSERLMECDGLSSVSVLGGGYSRGIKEKIGTYMQESELEDSVFSTLTRGVA